MRRRLAAAVGAVALVALLAGCAAPADEPIPTDIGGGIGDDPAPAGASAECREAFPDLAGTGELADAVGILPAEWPAPPHGAELCVVMVTSDTTAVLQYVSTAMDLSAVLDHYEVALQDLRHAGWEFVRGDGIGGEPILNVTGPDLEFAIQTDAGTGSYLAAFETLSS